MFYTKCSNKLSSFLAYYFLLNVHLLFFQIISDFPSVGRGGLVFASFFESFLFQFFPIPSVYQNFLHIIYLTFSPSHLILKETNFNVFFFIFLKFLYQLKILEVNPHPQQTVQRRRKMEVTGRYF